MSDKRSARRPYGQGSLLARHGSWYGQWRVGGRLVKRKLGKRRSGDDRSGLTRPQAERALARAIQETKVAPAAVGPKTFAEIAAAYLANLEQVRELKPTTLADYRSILRHWDHHFGTRPASRLTPDDFVAYMRLKLGDGLSRKTIRNHLVFAGGCLGYAVRRGWLEKNPIDLVDRPRGPRRHPDIRYLTAEELERLLDAVPDDLLGPLDRALYCTAAASGLRQGELIALRWTDVDFRAGAIRVRQSITRGRLGSPKSRRGSRSVPMADILSTELAAHLGRSEYCGDMDYVFCHPETGRFYDASRMRKRFKAALTEAGLRPARFHDLRHTFGTRMASVGVPLRTLQEWMGHESAEVTQIYADYAPNQAGEQQWVDRAFGGVDEGGSQKRSEGAPDAA